MESSLERFASHHLTLSKRLYYALINQISMADDKARRVVLAQSLQDVGCIQYDQVRGRSNSQLMFLHIDCLRRVDGDHIVERFHFAAGGHPKQV